MQANYMNYFKDGNCYQWDKYNNIFIITPTNIDPKLEFCLDLKMMETFLKFREPKLKLGKTLQVQENNLKVNLKICEANLQIPNTETSSTTKVLIDDLLTARNYVDKAGKQSVCQGVYIGKDTICATDAFYAYYKKIKSDANIVIPTEFISMLSSSEGEIELSSNENTVQAQIGDTIIIGRLIDGKYPPLDKVYANCVDSKQIEFNVKEFLNYLSFSTGKEDLVSLSKNSFKINGPIPFEATVKEFDVDCEIFIPVDRMKSVLKDIKEDKAIFSYHAPNRPCFINEEFLLLPQLKL